MNLPYGFCYKIVQLMPLLLQLPQVSHNATLTDYFSEKNGSLFKMPVSMVSMDTIIIICTLVQNKIFQITLNTNYDLNVVNKF